MPEQQITNRPSDKGADLNLVDIFMYLYRYKFLYILCVGIVVALALYRNARQPFTYEGQVKIFIRDASQRTMVDDNMLRYMRSSRLNVSNERIQLSSRRVMQRTVRLSGANVFYNVKSGLRTLELYDEAPFKVTFLDTLDVANTFRVSYQDASHVSIKFGKDGRTQVIPVGEPIRIGETRFIVEARKTFNAPWAYSEIQVSRIPFVDAVRFYQHSVAITQPEAQTSTLTLTLRDKTLKRALDILSAQVMAYNQEEVEMRNQISKNTAEFVNERLEDLSRELGLVEQDMVRFSARTKTIDFTSKVGSYSARSLEEEDASIKIEKQLKLVSYMLSQLNSPSKRNELMPLNIAMPDPELDGYITQYNQLKFQRDKLVESSGGSTQNPVIAEYDATLDQLRKSATEILNQQASALRARLKSVERDQSALFSKLPDVTEEGRAKADIDRRLAIQEGLYTELLSKREEYALRQSMTQDSAYILDMNDAPNTPPVSPNTLRTIVLAFLLGLALPTIFLIVRLLTDNKVRTRKDILDRLTIPFLGDIPKEERAKSGHTRGVREQGGDETSEAFRVLRENMRFMIGSAAGKTKKIIFTSFGESAGKSYVSYNLAKTLTFSGHRVVLVDLDLRKGTLSHRAGIIGKGVTEYLSDPTVQVDQIIRKDPNAPKLSVIASGAVPPNPAELLLGERLDELADKLSEQFDFVVFDNVPFGSVADAAIANRVADLTIFILRAAKLDRRALPELQRLYDDHVLTNMAMAMVMATAMAMVTGTRRRKRPCSSA